MAKGGDKRRVETNKRKLDLLWKAIIVADALHFGLRLVLFHSSVRFKHYLGFALINAVCWMCYNALAGLAKPTYGQDGEIISGGADLGLPGVTGYYFDVIYLCILVLAGTIVSDWLWLVLLAVPAYGLYQLYLNVIGPWLSMRKAGKAERPESEEERKRREKAEKRAQRRAGRYA